MVPCFSKEKSHHQTIHLPGSSPQICLTTVFSLFSMTVRQQQYDKQVNPLDHEYQEFIYPRFESQKALRNGVLKSVTLHLRANTEAKVTLSKPMSSYNLLILAI
jgi:hypothetical protein